MVANIILLVALAAATGVQAAGPDAPTWSWSHNYVGSDGQGHITECEVTNFTSSSVGPGIAPSWLSTLSGAGGPLATEPTTVEVDVMPVGWVGPLHKNPVPQFVVFLSGQGEWVAGSGDARNYTAGDVMFGEDQKAARGHTSRTIGAEPLVVMIIQYAQLEPTVNKPCWFN